jgi:hypothetical protein
MGKNKVGVFNLAVTSINGLITLKNLKGDLKASSQRYCQEAMRAEGAGALQNVPQAGVPGGPGDPPGGSNSSKGFFESWLSEDSYYLTGLIYGIGDGLLESIGMVTDLMKLKSAWNPLNRYFWTDEAKEIRNKSIEAIELISKLLSEEEHRKKVYANIKSGLSAWLDEVSFQESTGQAGYAHGKVAFDILLSLVGFTEIKYLLRTGEFSFMALRKIALASLRKTYKSFDDIARKSVLIKDKPDKAINLRRIEREYTGNESSLDHFQNLAEQEGASIDIKPNGTQVFIGKDGAVYERHFASQGSEKWTISKRYINEVGESVEDKIRFNTP